MEENKIEWCDCTINPIIGCSNGCKYCCAKQQNTKYKLVNSFSKPQYFPERLIEFKSKEPKSIFIDSLSDIALWSARELLDVAAAMMANPQHDYIAVTKLYATFATKLCALKMRGYNIDGFKELFLGVTVTNQTDVDNIAFITKTNFINVEPLLAPLSLTKILRQNESAFKYTASLSLVIIGAETGNRKNKAIPSRGWVEEIAAQASEHNLKVFMMESLKDIMQDGFRQDPLPWKRLQLHSNAIKKIIK